MGSVTWFIRGKASSRLWRIGFLRRIGLLVLLIGLGGCSADIADCPDPTNVTPDAAGEMAVPRCCRVAGREDGILALVCQDGRRSYTATAGARR